MSANPDSVNFDRLIHLIVDVGTKVLRKLFLKKIQPIPVQDFLSQPHVGTQINTLRKKHVINPSQNKLLTAYLIDKFDISLLVTLLTNICPDVNAPRLGWTSDPPDDDESLGADLIRLRNVRNNVIGHCARAQLNAIEFEHLWMKVEAVLKRMVNGLEFEAECMEEIKRIKETQIGNWEQLLTLLQAWRDQDDLFKEDTNRFKEDTNRRLDKLEKLSEKTTRAGTCGLQIEALGRDPVLDASNMDILAESNSDILSSKELEDVAGEIVSFWDIATELEFDDPQVQCLKQNFPHQTAKQHQVLLLTEWQKVLHQCHERPRHILAAALVRIENHSLAKQVAKGRVITEGCEVKRETRRLIKKISFVNQPASVLPMHQQFTFNVAGNLIINTAHFGNTSSLQGPSQPVQPGSNLH